MDSKLEKKSHSYKPQEWRTSVWRFFFRLGNGICCWAFFILGFPGSSISKESACNAGDPGLIPGSGISTGEGIGYLLQYSWAYLVAQLVKNPPTMGETSVWFLGWEDPLEKGKATHSSILAWRIPWTEESGRLQSMRSQHWKRLSKFHFYPSYMNLW